MAAPHPLNAAFAAWVRDAASTSPHESWEEACINYLREVAELSAPPAVEAAAEEEEEAAEEQRAAPVAREGENFFGKAAAEPSAPKGVNPFASQGPDLAAQARARSRCRGLAAFSRVPSSPKGS